MATTQHSIRLVKQFTYRGDDTQQFSNRYYFDGSSPGDSDAWHTLMDAWVAAERANYNSEVVIVQALGYAPGSDAAVASKNYSLAGTATITGTPVPGDCAAVLRMATTKVSVKNHTVYVFSYFHKVFRNGSDTTGDVLDTTQRNHIGDYANVLKDGLTVGGRTYKRTTPDGHATTGQLVDQYIGHRDFPR